MKSRIKKQVLRTINSIHNTSRTEFVEGDLEKVTETQLNRVYSTGAFGARSKVSNVHP